MQIDAPWLIPKGSLTGCKFPDRYHTYLMSTNPYEYDNCSLVRVVDGDTVILKLRKEYKIDFGFGIIDTLVKETSQSFRLIRINAPELKGETKAAAEAARMELTSLLLKGRIRVVSIKPDKYSGRYDAEIYVTENDKEFNVNDRMVELGQAVPYLVK